jgi:hypothetical protein
MVDPPPVAIATSGLRVESDARTTPPSLRHTCPVTWRSADVTAELIADFSAAQSAIERRPKTLVMRGEANRKNVQPVLRYRHQQGLIGRMMPLGELFADTDLGDAGGGAENI